MNEVSAVGLDGLSSRRSREILLPDATAGSDPVKDTARAGFVLTQATTDDESTAFMRQSLDTLIRLIERVSPGMRGTVLLLDDDGVTLRHGAAPNVPTEYTALIDGEQIGPAAGSCGTAAYRRERVVVRDIRTDPLWDRYRDAALPFGLVACWSTPILSRDGQVLGTFAMYYDEPRAPTDADIALTDTAALLAANIIYRARAVTTLRVREDQLRTSQRQLHLALDASGTSTWLWDMRTNVVQGDEGLFRLFGIDPEKEAGSFDVFVGRIHPDDRDRVIAAARRCATEGVELDEEFRIVHPDGVIRCAVDRGRVVRDDTGAPRQLIGACVDVTDRRLRETQFRALAESLPQLAWMADAKGWIYWYNQRWYEYTGTTLEDMQGWGWTKVHHPDHVERVTVRIQRAWDTGEPWEDTFPLRGSDGQYRWFLSRARPIRDADGSVVRWFGSNTDITELREAELERDRALQEATRERQRLYEVFMQAPAAISVLEGPEHTFVVANPLYRELVGGRDVLGKSVREALPELADQGFYELLDEVFNTGQPYTSRERVVRLDRDGDGIAEDFHVDFVYQPLKNAGGDTFGILVHAVEVTTQVRARTEIAAARAEAERANRAKSEFLAAMSHDLRTPLNAIGGYADLVKDGVYGPVSEGQRQAMTRVERAKNHLLSLINDILSFAKVEAGRIKLEPVDLPVNDVLQAAIPLIELQASNKGLVFTPHPAANALRARVDRERTVQILVNLLTNAVKFTATGSIDLEAEGDGKNVRIHVRDTGVGISRSHLESVFEPFVQVGRPEEQRQGVGLGLATSRELARAMGGELTVNSEEGHGSTFTLTLPRVSPP